MKQLQCKVLDKKDGVTLNVVLNEHEYLEYVNELMLNEEIGVNVNRYDVEVLSVEEVEEPRSQEDITNDKVTDLVLKHLDLYEACNRINIIYQNVLMEIRERGLWNETTEDTEGNTSKQRMD